MLNKFVFFDTDLSELDPKEVVNAVGKYMDEFIPKMINFVLILFLALVVFFIGRKIINFVVKLVKRSFERAKIEVSVARFLESLIKVALNVVLIIIVITIVGIPTTSFIALMGSAGLAIGLSLQGSLSNFAGGVLILLLKPFKVGDYIIEGGGKHEGEVTFIDIFYTKILTNDNKTIVIPNGALSNTNIINMTVQENRRLDMNIIVDVGENIKTIREMLEKASLEYELTIKERPVLVYVNSCDTGTINMVLSIWVKTNDYWTAKYELLEKIKESFGTSKVTINF